MFGKLGSGKRTLAAQVAIRIAKKNSALKLRIVTERDAITEDLESMHSTILVIHDPVKAWYTDRYTEEITSILLRICSIARNKNNNLYIIAIFHCNDWNLLPFEKKKTTLETMFPKRQAICGNKTSVKLADLVKNNRGDISNVRLRKGEKSNGESFEMTLIFKNHAFQQDVLDNTIMSIIEALKTLERSNENYKELAFKTMVIVMLRGGKIAKQELLADDISQHGVFADLKKRIDIPGSIIGCIEQLLKIFLEETEDGRSYRMLHDVVTRCTFIIAFENHRTLLFTECDPILMFECLRLKPLGERFMYYGKLCYDYGDLKIGIPSELFKDIAELFFQRTEMRNILRNNRIYEDEKFKDEWNKAEQHFTNKIHVTNKTHK